MKSSKEKKNTQAPTYSAWERRAGGKATKALRPEWKYSMASWKLRSRECGIATVEVIEVQ
jgi:hypothetical protein